jgi:hypothetical protein
LATRAKRRNFNFYTNISQKERQKVSFVLRLIMLKNNGYKSVTLCEKPNVIRETSGMMYKMALANAKS